MKNFVQEHTKLLTVLGIVLCSVLIVSLTFQLISVGAKAQPKAEYPEPAVRPDIREDAVWDSELGMYVSSDFKKEEAEKLKKDPDGLNSDSVESPEEIWLKNHADSQNEIDLCIKRSVELASEAEPSLFSSASPRASEAILTAMSALSPASYPEVWERLCKEPVFRPQKLVALEQFLSIEFRDLGLYDALAQRLWFDSFNALRKDVSGLSSDAITKEDLAKYGNLLLPALSKKAADQTLQASELGVLNELIANMNHRFHQNMEPVSLASKEAAADWFKAHKDTVDAIEKILQNDFTWAE